jgi:hypothetical protein
VTPSLFYVHTLHTSLCCLATPLPVTLLHVEFTLSCHTSSGHLTAHEFTLSCHTSSGHLTAHEFTLSCHSSSGHLTVHEFTLSCHSSSGHLTAHEFTLDWLCSSSHLHLSYAVSLYDCYTIVTYHAQFRLVKTLFFRWRSLGALM